MSTQHETQLDLASWLGEILALDPTADALQFEGRWHPWSWLSEATEPLTASLSPPSVDEGARIGVLMRNRPEIVRTVIAALSTRKTIVTLSPAMPAHKVAEEVRRLDLPVVVAPKGDWADGTLTEAVESHGSIGLAASEADRAFEVVTKGAAKAPSEPTPGVAVQMLTSGTTGPPKRVDLLYSSLEGEIASTARYTSSGGLASPGLSSGTSILWAPLVHLTGLRTLITAVVGGRKIALLERFDVEPWSQLVQEHRPRALQLVPTALAMVLAADLPRETFDGVAVVTCGTARLDPEVGQQFEERYGVPVLTTYGATEFAGGVAGWTLADWREFGAEKAGSVGRPNHGIEIRIVDETSGRALPAGEVGLLEVCGHQLVQQGWVATSDLASVDADGFVWIAGRADDVLIRGGLKVSAEEVRSALIEHPAVHDACVVGIEDSRLGQVPVAVLELLEGTPEPEADALDEWLRDRLSPYMIPVEYRTTKELPRTPAMKVRRAAVEASFQSLKRL